jgi:xylulokinase
MPTESSFILGIDIGSSSCKAGLFDLQGTCRGIERRPSPITRKEEAIGKREYDPELWWASVSESVRGLLQRSRIAPEHVAAVGLSGQIGTHLIVNRGGTPLRPAVSWQDGRAWREAEELARRYPDNKLDDLIGMHLPPGAAWPIPRLLWTKRNEPQLITAENRWVQPKDFILFRLTGRLATDVLSLRGLMEPRVRRVHETVAKEILEIDFIESMLPPVLLPAEVAGGVSAWAARATGLRESTPVVVGCGDFHCALVGSGVINEEHGFNVTGTSDHIGVLIPRSAPISISNALGRYPSAVDGYDIVYWATSSSGGMIEWFLTTFELRNPGESSAEAISRLAGKARNSRGIVCLPYLNGERAPIWDSHARGAFVGFGSGHDISNFMLAVLEGVAFSLRHCQEFIDSSGLSRRTIRICGAAAKNSLWNRIKADVLQKTIVETECQETGCLGAAVLAATGAGMHGSIQEAVRNMVRESVRTEPDIPAHPYYDDLYGTYREAYESLRPQFLRLAEFRERERLS